MKQSFEDKKLMLFCQLRRMGEENQVKNVWGGRPIGKNRQEMPR